MGVLARCLGQECDKAERLLRNVLPDPVAQELKRTDRVVPREYDSASILFSDFVGFTRFVTRLRPGLSLDAAGLVPNEAVFDLYERLAQDAGAP